MERIDALTAILHAHAEKAAAERSRTQMTLGEAIELLSQIDADTPVSGLGELDSYRGYYSDLSFDPMEPYESVGDMLADCSNAMGRCFTGYKGGSFWMTGNTPLWVATYSMTGPKLMGFEVKDGALVPITEEEEW